MKLLFNIGYWTLLAGITGVGLLLIASLVPVSGIEIKVVKSGSMEPAIHTGGIVVIRKESAYRVGDIVTFGADTKTQIPTTHRIVAVGEGADPIYKTKGDANDAVDNASTRLSDIHGKVIVTAPYVGYVLDFAKRPLGFFLLIGVPALAIIFDEFAKIFREMQRMRRRRKNGGDDRGSPGTPTAPAASMVPPPVSSTRSRAMDGIRARTYVHHLSYVPRVAPVRTIRRQPYLASLVVLFLAFALTTYALPVGRTVSYFSDRELSFANVLRAMSIDLLLGYPPSDGDEELHPLDPASATGFVDADAGTTMQFSFITYKSPISAPFFYTVTGLFDPAAPAECAALELHATLDSYIYDGPLNAFVAPATSTLGVWSFEVRLPPGSGLADATVCEASLTFYAEPTEMGGILGGIFSDTEVYALHITNHVTAPPLKTQALFVESFALPQEGEAPQEGDETPPPADEADTPLPSDTPPSDVPPTPEDPPSGEVPPPAPSEDIQPLSDEAPAPETPPVPDTPAEAPVE